MNVFSMQAHDYDNLLHHKSPLAIRLKDHRVDRVRVGDLVEFNGHNSLMDRQRFRVVSKIHHPSVHEALSSIQHSDLSTRDKIRMADRFLGVHGETAKAQPVVSLRLEPHDRGAFNRSVGSL